MVAALASVASLMAASDIQLAPPLSAKVVAVGNPSSGLTALNDGRWGNASWSVSNGSWAAYKVGTGSSRLLVAWNVPTYSWSNTVGCQNGSRACLQGGGIAIPTNYDILVSANSTNGQDGDWTSAVTVTSNAVSSRSHYVAFQGKSWVKLRINAGTGSLDALDVFDASASHPEGWFFVGNSITAGAWKSVTLPAAEDFSTRVATAAAGRVPPVVRGGIPCIITADVANDISRYLENSQGMSIWAISLGTNDAWGGNSSVSGYRSALVRILDTLQARGIKPVLARIPAVDASITGWQVNKAYLDVIDSLTKARNLTPGPDLYGHFLSNPSELGPDGVHPANPGYASIQRLWAEVAAKMSVAQSTGARRVQPGQSAIQLAAVGRDWQVSCSGGCREASATSLDGRETDLVADGSGALTTRGLKPGMYALRVVGRDGRVLSRTVMKP
jgi:lysophospholipase L1-like esterase